ILYGAKSTALRNPGRGTPRDGRVRIPMTRRRLAVLPAAALALVAALGLLWRSAIERNRSTPDEPFRIAGNLYYVGAAGVTSFLLAGPEGHVLIDGGYPETAPAI